MQKRWIVRGLIVVGALASLGTEQAPGWYVTTEQPIHVSLDATASTVKYLVHVELRGGPFETLDGYVAARIDISPSQASATPNIAISSLTHPDEMISVSSVPQGYTHDDVFIDAWLACESFPCAEDYEVTITGGGTQIAVDGVIQAHAGGGPGEDQPAGTEVLVTVTGPM